MPASPGRDEGFGFHREAAQNIHIEPWHVINTGGVSGHRLEAMFFWMVREIGDKGYENTH